MCGGVVVYMYMCEGGLFGSLLAGNLPNIVDEVSLISLKRMARYFCSFCCDSKYQIKALLVVLQWRSSPPPPFCGVCVLCVCLCLCL